MSLIHYTAKRDGFCGLFSPIAENRNTAVIMLEDGPPDSYLVKTALKWLNRSGVSAMGIGPDKRLKGVHNWPLENIENAVRFSQPSKNGSRSMKNRSPTGRLSLRRARDINKGLFSESGKPIIVFHNIFASA